MDYIAKYFKVKIVKKRLTYVNGMKGFFVIRDPKDEARSCYYLSTIIGGKWHKA
jgi:hypothetical protein